MKCPEGNFVQEKENEVLENTGLELGKTNKTRRTSGFRKLFRIWKGRKVTIDDLRQKAWQRKTS